MDSKPKSLADDRQRLLRAIDLQKIGDHANASRLFLTVLQNGSFCFEALYSLGVSSTHLQPLEMARACFGAALAVRPTSSECSSAYDAINLKFTNTDKRFSKASTSISQNHYFTYFDSNYAHRGLVMIESLLSHDTNAYVHVLCLDEQAFRLLNGWNALVTPYEIENLVREDREFAAARNNRTLIEWYFTATSVFCDYLLTKHIPDVQRLTYLDSDLYFYASPNMLHDECVDSTAQIIEHRFSKSREQLKEYGRFNVGWITFSNTPEGRRLVSDYRRDCIHWCHDRLEHQLFADQKYLDYWPDLYADICISKLIGANVAPWNIGRYHLQKTSESYTVDGEPLIFYHFSGIRRSQSGSYSINGGPLPEGPINDMYSEYLDNLLAMEKKLAVREEIIFREIRYTKNAQSD